MNLEKEIIAYDCGQSDHLKTNNKNKEKMSIKQTKTLVTYSLSIEAKEQAKSKAAKKGKSASGYIQELILKAK